MKHKKLKIFIFIVLLFLLIMMIFGSCKKTKALESVFLNNSYEISGRSQDEYNFVAIYDFGSNNNLSSSYNIMYIYSGVSLKYYLNINNNNQLTVTYNPNPQYEVYTLTSRIIQINIVEDTNYLYLIVYCINFNILQNQGVAPIIDGVNRTMICRYSLSSIYDMTNDWEQGDIRLVPLPNESIVTANCLLNCSFVSIYETPQDINNWVDKQVLNNYNYNKILTQGYNYGNEDGYLDGFDDGEERGYSDGYDEGYDDGELVGHAAGYEEGANVGYTHGFDEGYRDGWADGQAGETAITPAFNTLSAIFGVIGSILAVQLVPGVPLGLFFLVPLFFAVLGLILWIWRRN